MCVSPGDQHRPSTCRCVSGLAWLASGQVFLQRLCDQTFSSAVSTSQASSEGSVPSFLFCSPRAEHSQDMAPCFWVCVWTSVTAVLSSVAAQPPYYSLQQSRVPFDQAAAACSPGLLTSLATHQEVDHVLALISRSVPPPTQAELTFWVGLRKAKNECMVPVLPLRGFKWTSDGSDVTQVSRWAEEPEHTCTTVRCAALKAQLSRPAVAGWGLIPVSCRSQFPFICKHTEPLTPTGPSLEPTSAEPEPQPSSLAPEPQNTTPEPENPVSRAESNYPPDSHYGSQQDGGSGSCRRPSSSAVRSLIPDPKDPGRIQVECWSPGVLVEVRCSGQPALWRLLDGSVANFSSICVPCDDGFHKSASGTCEDVNECQTGAPCRHGCLNTLGSYSCVCTDEKGDVVSEDSPTCRDTAGSPDRGAPAGPLIPALVAVAALVVLVLLVAVMIKCCVMRRSKRRAAKKAEKMSMDSKDEEK